jgi:hypothetical protein
VIRLLLTVFFFEAGLVLDQNYFAQLVPSLRTVLENYFVRGAVSGLGLVNLLAGVAEIWTFLASRHLSDPVVSIRRTPAAEE